MQALELKIPPPLVGVLVAGAMWLAAPIGPAMPFDAGLRTPLAIALVVAGLGIDLAGLLAFRRARTTVNPLRPERASALVAAGVYRFTRNPMYLGMALLLTGWAVQLGGWLPLAGPLAFAAWITRFQILPEERVLRQRFGPAFDVYAARVRRWL